MYTIKVTERLPHQKGGHVVESVDRRSFLKAAGLLATSGALGAASFSETGKKPNIILIMADDVGREVPGCFGGTTYKTPNIDRLAKEGSRFNHVYAAPVCHPSRITLMTGRYPFKLGTPGWGTFPKAQTFARELKKAGYATAVAGKWQLTLLGRDPEQPHRLGFDGYCLFGWHEGPRYWQPHIWQDGKRRTDVKDRYGPDVYADFLVDFMKAHKGGPFFLYYPMVLCHDVSDDFKPFPPYGPGMDRYENYKEMVDEMDRIVGRITDSVDALGIADETLILFTTDNGTESETIVRHEKGELLREKNVSSFHGEQILGGKGQLTDWGIRVPTIARWPGIVPAGRSNDELIDFTDFLPTFNELAGLPAPSFEIDGNSFAALLTGGNHQPREWIFSQRSKNDYCLRTERWKLCHNGRLYDTREDPSEKNPINPEQDTPESAEARKRLTKLILDLMK